MAVSADDGPAGGAPPPPPPPLAAYPDPPVHDAETPDGAPAVTDGVATPETTEASGLHLARGGLVVSRPFWRRPSRILFAALLVAVFIVPERVGGLWWFTLAVSEAVAGVLIVAGTTAHRRLGALAAAGFVLLGAVGLEAYNDVAFGTLSLSGPPPLVFVCGTEYASGAPSPITLGGALHRVGTTPSGMAVLVNLRCGGPHSVWAFVSTGPGMVIPYLADHYTGSSVPYWH